MSSQLFQDLFKKKKKKEGACGTICSVGLLETKCNNFPRGVAKGTLWQISDSTHFFQVHVLTLC